MRRVLIFSHTTGYQLRAFDAAAESRGIELVFATDRCHRLDDPWQDRTIAVRFFDADASLAAIARRAEQTPVHGVIAVGDRPVPLAARAAAALAVPWHSPEGALASVDKRRARAAMDAAGLPTPSFRVLPVDDELSLHPNLRFPVVLKPLGLSGSRGVIRADDMRSFAAAFSRIRTLLQRPQIRAARSGLDDQILVEEYIPGREFAVEGVMTGGELRVFALFDKPDPLEGPFFEETIYVTPSQLAADTQRAIEAAIGRAARAMGLGHGPVHAECRVTPTGQIYILEVAARPIGGLCSRVLTFARAGTDDTSLESVLLRHAVGESIEGFAREARGAAVMMIPIPRAGMLRQVRGEAEARATRGVTDVRITAKQGQLVEPLPEAGSYLGFIFGRGDTAADAQRAVRLASARLTFDIAPALPVNT